jgi:N-acetylneuraminic acid mutarotase
MLLAGRLLSSGAFALLLIVGGSGCSLKSASKGSTLSLVVPNPRVHSLRETGYASLAPSAWNSSAFECYAINVVGSGIADTSPNPSSSAMNLSALMAGTTSCAYRGVISNPFRFSTGASEITVDLQVPPGSGRVIQLIGITNAAYCGSNFLSDDSAGAYELGHVVADLFGDTTVAIPITYTASETRRVDCGSSSSAATLVPSIAAVTVTNGAATNSTTFNLTYSGVSGTYDQYCILENSTTEASCTWVVGSLPATYTVTATENAKVLSFWIKNSTTNLVSTIISANSVVLDTTAPALASATITDTSPSNAASASLTYGAVTGTYAKYCIKRNDTTAPAIGNACWTAGTLPGTFAIAAEGAAVLSVWIADAAGNISTRVDTTSVTYDHTAPTLSISAPTGTPLAGGSSVNVTWTAADTAFGATPIKVEYTTDSGTTYTVANAGVSNTGTYAWTVPNVAVATGAGKVRLTATDTAGNATSVVSASFSVIGPATQLTVPAPNVAPSQFECILYSGSQLDALGRDTVQTGSARTITLSMNTVSGSFYDGADSYCLTPISTVTVAVGLATYSFRFVPTTTVAGTISNASAGLTGVGFAVTPFERLHWNTPLANAPLNARSGQSTVYTGTEMMIWGGLQSASPVNTGMRYNTSTDTWTSMTTVGAPTARSEHSAVWTGSEMIVFGGMDGSVSLTDGGRYNPSTNSWTTMSNMVYARANAAAVWTGSVVLVFGGCSYAATTCTNALESYNPTTNTWTSLATSALAGRQHMSYGFSGTKFMIWGGGNLVPAYYSDGAVYDTGTTNWTNMAAASLTAREGAGSVVVSGKLYIWGGTNGAVLAGGAKYDPVANTWTTLPTAGAPAARAYFTPLYDGIGRIFVWGGYNGTTGMDTGAVYETAGIWRTSTSMTGVAAARWKHSAVWDPVNRRMLIWGGEPTTGTQPVYRFEE